jgi:hypothetical protein
MAVINQPNFFPASNVRRRYLPNVLLVGANVLSTANIIWLYPIFIKKYVENPTFCIELTSNTSTGSPTVTAGIYEGVDIFSSGRLLFSTDFNLLGLNGILKNPSTLKLRPGWHTIASTIKTAPATGSITYRSVLQNLSFPFFGIAQNAVFFSGLYGSFGVNSASLPANLSGQTIVRQGGAGILVALEY